MITIGHKLGGRYKIIDYIGSGGMANVYLARDLILNRNVAVKVLRYDFQDNRDSIRRFKREALSATQLSHPNIVAVYDVDEEDNQQYIVMEYNDGQDLKQYIKEHGPLNPKRAVYIMEQLLSAMSLAHQHRIIHRDIKPQNILIDKEDHVQLTDFGIAVALSDTTITQTNTLLGSVHYLSPEQARGRMATVKSDIYALGIVLYELLTAKVPFDGDSPVSIALKHFQEDLPSIRDIYPKIPQALENVVLKATAKDPLNRYSSCDEMAKDISTSLDPDRRYEKRFVPNNQLVNGDTRVLKPVPELLAETKRQQDLEESMHDLQATESEVEPLEEKATAKQSGPKKSRKRKIISWTFFAVLMAIFAAFIIWIVFYNNREQEVAVPDVVNLTQAEAKSQLEAIGLQVGDVTEQSSEDVDEDHIISTDPKATVDVKPGSTVNLVVSTGSETVEMADYTGEDYETARDALRALGFNVERYEEASDEYSPGKVIAQSVDEGEKVNPSKTTVALTVSTGQELITIADLSGFSQTAVENYAKTNELTLTVTEENNDEIPAGILISQNPKTGAQVAKGSELAVVISLGANEPETETFNRVVKVSYVPSTTDSNGDSGDSDNSDNQNNESGNSSTQANHVEIYMEDNNNSYDTVAQELEITENTEVTLTFTLDKGKSGRYKVVRDGVTVEENNNVRN